MIKTVDDEFPKPYNNIWVYFLSIVPAVLTALLAPDNVLTQQRWLANYTAFYSELIPSIDRLAAVSTFPEVTRLVLSIEWTFLPLQIVLFAARRSYVVRIEEWRARRFFLSFCLLMFASVLFWSVILLYDIAPSDLQGSMLNESLLRTLSTSRLGLGIVSSVYLAGTALIAGVLCIWVRHVPHIYLGYEGEQQ